MTYEDIIKASKENMEGCYACKVCDGKACSNHIPGPGSKGTGDVAIRNYDAWKNIRINMDTLCEKGDINTEVELFGQKFKYPIFVGPVGAIDLHYGKKYDDNMYNSIMIPAASKAGVMGFTGDGVNPKIMDEACRIIKENDGFGVPTIKPWDKETIFKKLDLAVASGAKAIAMDVDAAGLPFLKGLNPPAGPLSLDELKEVVAYTKIPFIIKGVMNVKTALKAKEAGAYAIVVSNHGGRVLDQTPATAEVLKDIKEAVGDSMKIFVDGGLRNGTDIFKALALGADAVLVCRPFVNMVYGAGAEGVECLVNKLGAELADTMFMCGPRKLSDINIDNIWGK